MIEISTRPQEATLPSGPLHKRPGQTPRLIIHVIDELKVGGAQTHIVTMLREAMGSVPIEHKVVSLFGDGTVGDQIRALGVEVIALDLRPQLARNRFVEAVRILTRLFRDQRPDIIEAHLTWSRLLGVTAAWRAGVPLRVAFEHGDLYLNSWKFRVGHGLAQHFAHQVIVVSRALEEWARGLYGLSPGRRSILLNCVDLDKFHPDPTASAPALGLPPAETLFCSVGTLGRGVNKRMDLCIRAVHYARARGGDLGLAICGDGEQRRDLEALAESLGVARYIGFLGRRDDVPRVLAACQAFCLATEFDPCPIACLEAMAVGLPAVVPGAGGMVEVVDHNANGLIYPVLDFEALGSAMLALHNDPARRKAMGDAARRKMEEHFSVAGYVRRLYRFYGL